MSSAGKDYMHISIRSSFLQKSVIKQSTWLSSSLFQLLSALNDWHASLNSDEPVSVIYTDLAKAFDKVSHVKLLEVVKSYGIEGNLYNWIKSFLSDRKQHVSIKQSISESRDVLSGVPQGSVMGPLLFLMYIDDVSKLASANTSICLFADDTKVYSTNQTELQNVLNDIAHFFTTRQLSLAPEKCEQLTICKKSAPFDIYLENTLLKKATAVKDLGIYISSDLTWKLQVNTISRKAFQRSYHIMKSFSTKNI